MSIPGLLLAGVLAATAAQAQPAVSSAQDAPARLEDIEVTGRSLDSLVRRFVDEVAAPNPRRNLARWNGPVCVGVSAAHFSAETAGYIADRVSTVAADLGLRPGGPGCTPTILVLATDQPDELAARMIERRPRSLRPGGTGMERGAGALRAFLSSSHPVRWWAVSMPTDSQTGARAVRLPGDCEGSCAMGDMDVLRYAPTISMTSSSRIRTQIVDDLFRVIVLVDATRLEKVSALQLADYIAMVSLAQIDPEADTRDYASILNVFEEPDFAASLTDWDMAYLSGLYRSQRTLSLAGANRSEVSAAIRRAHLDLRGSED